MRFNKLDLNQLVSLEALLKEKNVSKAAEKLNISQSAMSNSLARLRNYFEDEILIKHGRSMMLTPLAIKLAPDVESILARVHLLTTQRNFTDVSDSNAIISISLSSSSHMFFLSKVIKKAYVVAPKIRFRISQIETGWQNELDEGVISAVIIPKNMKHGGHPYEALFSGDFCCVVCKNNPLVNGVMDANLFYSLSHIIPSCERDRDNCFDQGMHTYLDNIKVDITTPYASQIPLLVIGSERIGITHRKIAESFCKVNMIDIYDLPFESPRYEVIIQFNQIFRDDPLTQWFINLFVVAASEISDCQKSTLLDNL